LEADWGDRCFHWSARGGVRRSGDIAPPCCEVYGYQL